MEKIKGFFGKVGNFLKTNKKVALIVLVVVVALILILNLAGGSKKRAIKKYISAINSCDYNKIVKAMDVEGAVAWKNSQTSSYDYSSLYDDEDEDEDKDKDKKKDDNQIEKFSDEIEDVDDDEVDKYKDSLKDQYDDDDKGKTKVKLLKVVYTTKAKDNKDVVKAVCKVRVTVKPDADDDDDDKKEDSLWEKEKEYTATHESYVNFYLYKGKVISAGL